MLLRRSGFKLILAKDAYVHHFGSVSIKADKHKIDYTRGRQAFSRLFGFDPWECYEPSLILALPLTQAEPVSILGVNCGLGSNPLKVKDSLREKRHNDHVTVFNVTTRPELADDLRGVSDAVQLVPDLDHMDLSQLFPHTLFQYILVGIDPEKEKVSIHKIKKLDQYLTPDGVLAVRCSNPRLREQFEQAGWTDGWLIIRKQ